MNIGAYNELIELGIIEGNPIITDEDWENFLKDIENEQES